jgi:RNA polymerase sigma factor (sigma-70 family)
MATSQPVRMIQHLRRAVLRRELAALSDGQLLGHYVEHRDEAAFEALVRRHGSMVLGVCRRILGNVHDADDAFQAAFLVLVRKAGSVVPREMIANWLHGVARQTAVKARAMSARRRRREQQLMASPDVAVSPREPEGDWQELLDEELSRLPEKYRAPIVLCDLEGKTRKDAARQLGWPEGTVSGRLSRARALLARRLRRRGVALSAAALAAALTPAAASASVSLTLADATTKAASLFAAGQASLQSVASAVAEGVLKTMLLTKLKNLVIGSVTVALVLALGSAVGHRLMADDRTSVEAKAGNLRDTILVLDQQFWEAAAKHDVETLGRLFASDYLGLGNDGIRWTKPALLDQHRQFRLAERKFTTAREVVRINEHTAILTYEATFKVFNKAGKQTDAAHQRLTSCWVQRDGGWFVKFSQATKVDRGSLQAMVNEANFDVFQTYPQFLTTNVPFQLVNPNLQYLNQPVTSSFLRPHDGFVSPIEQSLILQPNSPFVSTFTQADLSPFIYNAVTFPSNASVQQTPTDKALQQLIEKALKAHGGENALRRLTAFTLNVKETDATGRVSMITHFVQLPDHYRVEISRQGENTKEIHILGPDGMKHWRQGTDGKVEALHLFGLEPTREYWLEFVRFFGPRAVLRLKEPAHQLKQVDEIDVHFRPAVGIQLTASASATSGKSFVGPDRKLYFDKETGLLVKQLHDHLELLYGAHKSLNGITSAQKWSERRGKDQEPTNSIIQEFKVTDKLDPALFQKP